MYAYCGNNPVNFVDYLGNWPQWVLNAANWVDNNIIQPVTQFFSDIKEDISNYDKNNDDVEVTYSSNYFSHMKIPL